MNQSAAQTAIVFSCDQGYFFLARGLVLSLADAGYPNADAKVVLIDIGCEPESLAWMREHGVEVVAFDASFIPASVRAIIKPSQRAMVMRPWLPQMLPGYEHIIWLDCDLWLQNGEAIGHFRAGANMLPQAVMLAPGSSHYNLRFYTDIEGLIRMQRIWYEACCEPDVARKLANVVHFSSAVFGMRRSSPIWGLWGQEIERVYPLVAQRNPQILHMAELISMNIVLSITPQYIRLDPLYNFHCNGGGAIRLADGRVVTNMMLPVRDIGVIHLANWSLLKERYVSLGLLYRSGEYLTDAEKARIAQ